MLSKFSRKSTSLLPPFEKTSANDHTQPSQTAEVDSGLWYFLFPSQNIFDGGLLAQKKFLALFNEILENAIPITYEHKRRARDDLNDIISSPPEQDSNIYCIHYGPHIKRLIHRLRGRKVIYFAHSTGWNFELPEATPVIAVSKHCAAYWARKSSSSPIFYLPNIISDKFNLPFFNPNANIREIDVLVFKRKMSRYLTHELLPILEKSYNVKTIESWTKKPERYMQQAKIFLYDSSNYWRTHKASEGFGLPPLEALACGCTVITSLNDGLSDFMDPIENCHQLLQGNTAINLKLISSTLTNWQEPRIAPDIVSNYRTPIVKNRASHIVKALEFYSPVFSKA